MGKIKLLRNESADTWWGTRQTLALQRDVYERLIINVSLGSLSGGTSPSYITNASLFAIRDITVQTENHVLTAIPQTLYELQKLESGTAPQLSNTVANIEFWFTKKVTDYDYGVDFRKKNTLTISLNMRPLSEITSGSPTATSGTTIRIFGVVAPAPTDAIYGFDVKRSNQTSTSNEYRDFITYNDSDKVFDKILLFTTTDAGQMTASNLVIDNYTVRRGNFDMIYDHLPWSVSQAMDKKQYNIESVSTGVTVIDDLGLTPSAGSELIIDIFSGSAQGYVTALARYMKPL